MKRLIFVFASVMIGHDVLAQSQSLFVPNGFTNSGIGESTVPQSVGVGTNAPRGKFDVDGPGDIYLTDDVNAGTNQSLFLPGHLYIAPYNGSNVSYLQARRKDNSGSTSLIIRTFNNGSLTEAMHVSGNGNIGIGTNSPDHNLEITNNVGMPSLGLRGHQNAKIKFMSADGNERFSIASFMDNYTWNDKLEFKSPMASILTLRGDGNVGIGTTGPNEKLTVNGNIHVPLQNSVGYLQSTDKFTHNGNTVGNYSLGWYNDSWVSGAPSGYLSAFGGLKIFTFGNPRLVVTGQGNVGIGTTTPDHKLTVDGGVKCEEVKVEIFTGTGPDYVFEPDYDLPSLSEIESYIKQNKHLPEVPSAKEMEAEGLNLKEMNLLLLKKVEELTLHLIEMKKEVVNLREDNNELQKYIGYKKN